MQMVSYELIKNLALIVAMSMLFTLIIRNWDIRKPFGQLLAGLFFGVITSFGILNSYLLETGIIFDGRSVVLPMAAIFAGVPAAIVAAVLSAAVRIYVGGGGIISGLLTIFLATAGGILFRYLREKKQGYNKVHHFYFAGLLIHVMVVIGMAALPRSSQSFFINQVMPVFLLVFPVAFTLLAILLNDQQKSHNTLKRLKESEENYQLLSDATYEGIIVSRQGRILEMNHAARKMLGYTLEEARTRNLFEGIHPDYVALVREKTENLNTEPYEIRVIRSDGTVFPVEVQAKSARFRFENVRITAIRNITDRKIAEERLLKNTSLFQEAERITRMGHWEMFVATRELNVSEGVKKIYEISQDGNLFSYPLFLRKTHPDDRRMVYNAYNQALTTGKHVTIENRILSGSGSVKYIRQSSYSEFDKEGKPLRSFGIVIDITEQKLAEEEVMNQRKNLENQIELRTADLERSRKAAINLMQDANQQRLRAENALRQLEASHAEVTRLSQAVEQSLAAVAITNTEGEAEYVNRTFVEFTGYSMDEIRGKKLNIMRDHRQSESFYRNLWETIKQGKSWKGEFQNRHKSGRLFWESVVISPIFNENNQIIHYVKIAQDITERKKLEEDLIIARDKADQATRAKSEFLANMSHEIRTPMNAILGFADLLTISLDDQRSLDYLNSLKVSGKNLLNLINDILDLSKVEAGMLRVSFDYINIRQLISEVRQVFYFKAQEKGLQMVINIDEGLPSLIYLDETRLQQVIINLVSNALKYTDSGSILLDMQVCEGSTRPLSENESEMDIVFKITDTGIGISEEFQKVIFESFTQEEGHDRRVRSGTGLGLAITRKLVELMNGKISVKSQQGKGSTFSVVFYKVKTSTMEKANENKPLLNWDTIRFHNELVLVVDDMEDNLRFLRGMLEYLGLKVVTASNGEEALSILGFETPRLVITDIRMPGLDGFGLLENIRNSENLRDIPVVAASASVMHDPGSEQRLHDFDGYLLKPLQIPELVKELTRFLDQKHTTAIDEIQHPESEYISLPENIDRNTLMDQLISQATPLWEQLRERQPIKKVEEFAGLLIEIGEQFQAGVISNYGNELLSARKSFNIENMVKLIRQYPELTDRLISKLASENEKVGKAKEL